MCNELVLPSWGSPGKAGLYSVLRGAASGFEAVHLISFDY